MGVKVLKERRKVCISLACVAGMLVHFLNLNFCPPEISGPFSARVTF